MTETAVITLTATARLARQLHEQWDAAARARGWRNWASPRFIPLRAWARQVVLDAASGHIVLSRHQAQQLWEAAILESPEGAQLLDIRGAAAIAGDAWNRICDWRVPLEEGRFAESDDAAAFWGWLRSFRRRTTAGDFVEPARIIETAIALLPGIRLDASEVRFAGFDRPPAVVEQLQAALEALGIPAAFVDPEPRRTEQLRPQLARCTDASEELRAAAEWARAWLEVRPRARLGIVVPDLAIRRDGVQRMFQEVLCPGAAMFDTPAAGLPFHIGAGGALNNCAAIRTALLALGLAKGSLALHEAGSLIRSPYLGSSASERSHRALADAELRRPHPARVTFDALLAAARKHAPQLARLLTGFDEVRKRLPQRARASQWSAQFTRLLRALEWPGRDALTDSEARVVEEWDRLLSQFAALEGFTGSGALSAPDALGLLEELAADTRFEVEDQGQPVQILDFDQTPGLEFDALWVCGMTAANWPRPASPNPFLPLSLAMQHRVPGSSALSQLDDAIRVTRRLIGSASQEVHFSYAAQEGDRALRPSPLLTDLDTSPVHAADSLWPPMAASLEVFTDSHGPPAPDSGRDVEKGGTRILELQAQCPFRAFAEIRLGAGTLESAEAGLNARDRGSLLHVALEQVWERLGSHATLAGMAPAELKALVTESIEAALQHRYHRHALDDPFEREVRRIEASRLLGQLVEWLAFEATRPPFEVVEREQHRAVAIGELRFEARADRVDRLASSGEHVILDYKTGKVSAEEWEGDRPGAPQLPIYLLSHPQPIAALAFARISAEGFEFEGLAARAGVLPDVAAANLDGRKAGWQSVFQRLAAAFLEGDARVDPKTYPATCDFCHLHALCRIAPAHRDADESAG